MGEQCDLLSSLRYINGDGTYNPYLIAFVCCTFYAALTFTVSTWKSNYSQVDKLWSIVPFLYTWMTVTDERTAVMAFLATIWGVRLTANFYRRGGYQWPPWEGDEDYRWAHVKEGNPWKILRNPTVFLFFNLFFISIYQNILLLLITAPSFVAWTASSDPAFHDCYTPFNFFGLDGLATLLVIFFIAIETIADNQQYTFQTEKYRQKNAGVEMKGDYKDGFCQSGLFAYVRKPNYTAEQCIWISYYIFSIAAMGGKLLNWSIIGSTLLVLLFKDSGALTENITLKKYPNYSEYQKRVPLYIPSLSTVFSSSRRNEYTVINDDS